VNQLLEEGCKHCKQPDWVCGGLWLAGLSLHGLRFTAEGTKRTSGNTRGPPPLSLHGRTNSNTVRTQHGVTVSAGQRRGDVELRSYLQDAAGRRSLVFDLSMTHDRFVSSSHVQQNGLLSHPPDAPLRVAAQQKINSYRQQYADNQNISFLPAIVSTSTRMHGEFLRLLFLQAHRETKAHFTAAGMSLQRHHSDSFRFKRAAFYQSLKSKVGLAAAKAAALRINLNVESCGIVAAPVHALSRSPSPPPPSFTQSLSPAFISA
jgi:hypothetical protein